MKTNRQLLENLINQLGYSQGKDNVGHLIVKINDLEMIAGKLSAISEKKRDWSWNYLRSVLNDYSSFRTSKYLQEALESFGQEVLGQPAVEVETINDLKLLPGLSVRSGALIMASSIVCSSRHCTVEFIPRHPRQKYCCSACRKSEQREKQRDRRRVKSHERKT